jgi:hypothetical protein
MPDRASAETREAAEDVLPEARLHLEEVALVDDGGDDLVHVVGLVRALGDDRRERRVAAVGSSSLGTNGGSSRLLLGMNERSSRTIASVSASFSPSKCATPLLVACVSAPPSSSFVTSSCVTVLMTSGPVMNM